MCVGHHPVANVSPVYYHSLVLELPGSSEQAVRIHPTHAKGAGASRHHWASLWQHRSFLHGRQYICHNTSCMVFSTLWALCDAQHPGIVCSDKNPKMCIALHILIHELHVASITSQPKVDTGSTLGTMAVRLQEVFQSAMAFVT